jgi:hypothetical protein
MIVVNYDATHVLIDGIVEPKIYRARGFSNDKIQLDKIHTKGDYREPELFSNISIDGTTYGTQDETIEALNLVVYSGVGGEVSIADEFGISNGVYNPIETVSYNQLYASNIDLSRSTAVDFTGASISELFEDQYTTMVNSEATNPKVIEITFKKSVQSILAVLQASTGDFSNVKAYITFSNGGLFPIFDESADNTKKQNVVITASDVRGGNGFRIEFHTADTISLSSIFVPQINLTNALIQSIDTISGSLENITSTNGLLNVFTKEKEYESPVNKWGQNDDIDTGTTPETITDSSDLYTYTDDQNPVTYAASSTSGADLGTITAELVTLEPGTGDYIDEMVQLTLDGQNKVIFAPPSGNLVLGCNRAYNDNGVILIGDVYIYESAAIIAGGIPTVSTLIRSIITIEAQQTRQTPYIIPDIDSNGNRILEAHIIKWEASVVKTQNIVADVYFMIQEQGKIMRAQDIGNTKNGVSTGWEWGDRAPLKIPTKSRVEIRCVNISASDGSIVGKFQIQNVTENEQS